MAEAFSSNGITPHLQSTTTPDTPPDLSPLMTAMGSMARAVGPILLPPDPLSRGAVVQVSTVTGAHADLGGQTGRHLEALAREAPSGLFTQAGTAVNPVVFQQAASRDPHQYRLIVALPDAHRLNMRDVTRQFMAKVEEDTGRPLDWIGAIHADGPGPSHAHLVVRGRDRDGQALHLAQQYQLQGLRIRAQQVSTEALGPLSPLTHRGREGATWLAAAATARLEHALDGPRQQVNLLVMRVQQWTRAIPSLTVGQAIHREEARVGRLQTFARAHATALQQASTGPGRMIFMPGQTSPSREAVLSRLTPQSQQLLQAHARTVVGRERPAQTHERQGGLGR